jgi:eukaryotic-like serine/threonine-protein kinase
MLRAGGTLGGRYVLSTPIARGGMGEIWRADDPVLGRTVAVKVLLPGLSDDPGFATRFRVEARAMATLSDPAIVEIYDYGQDDDLSYLVMQFIEGESLHRLLGRAGPLEPAHVLTLVSQAATALHQAHRHGIVHRDVKPGNLLIRTDGRLMLTDFGIAHIVTADRMTDVGSIMGTAAYLAPEQVSGDRLTPATDIYALGVVAYECLVGRRPFVAETPIAVALKQLRDPPPPLPDDILAAVRELVLRALAKDPADRWPTAAAMAEAAGAVPLPPRSAFPPPVTAAPAPAPVDSASVDSASVDSASVGTQIVGTPAVGGRKRHRRGARLAAAAAALLVLVAGWGVLRVSGSGTPAATDRGRVRADDVAGALAAATAGPTPDPGATQVTAPSGPGGTPGPGGTGAPVVSGHPAGPGNPTGAPPTTAPPTRTTPPAHPTSPGSSPTSGLPTVPNVLGYTEAAAKESIRSAGLLPSVTYRSTTSTCTVVSESPAPATVVKPGATVNIVIGLGELPCQDPA